MSLPSWAYCSIIAAGALLSPVIAFLMALGVASVVGFLKDAGMAAWLAIIVTCSVAYLLVRTVVDLLVRGLRAPVAEHPPVTAKPARDGAAR